jgi:hypothetical protein
MPFCRHIPPHVGVLGAAQVVGGGAGLVPPGPPLQGLQPLQLLQGGQQGVGQAAGAPFPPAAQQQGFSAVGQAAFPPMGAVAQQQGYGAASQAAFYPPFGYGQYPPGQLWVSGGLTVVWVLPSLSGTGPGGPSNF